MPIDQRPIPPEALPPGWGSADAGEGRLAYRRGRPAIELIAARTDADRSHPSLGLGRCWELRYRFPLGERSVSESIGRVSTRRAAIDGLLACMNRVHEAVDDPDDPIEVRAALRDVSLSDLVPGDRSFEF